MSNENHNEEQIKLMQKYKGKFTIKEGARYILEQTPVTKLSEYELRLVLNLSIKCIIDPAGDLKFLETHRHIHDVVLAEINSRTSKRESKSAKMLSYTSAVIVLLIGALQVWATLKDKNSSLLEINYGPKSYPETMHEN